MLVPDVQRRTVCGDEIGCQHGHDVPYHWTVNLVKNDYIGFQTITGGGKKLQFLTPKILRAYRKQLFFF